MDSMDSVAERTVWTVWWKGQYGQAQFPEDSGLKGSGQQSTDTFATKEREVNTIEAFLKPTFKLSVMFTIFDLRKTEDYIGSNGPVLGTSMWTET